MRPIVLYDGDCGLCARGVQFILRHERGPSLDFAALDSSLGQAVRSKHGLAGQDTMIYVEGDRVWIRSNAALRIAGHLRAPWRWLRLFVCIPRPVRDLCYRGIANTRRRWSAYACSVPDAATRARFIDRD